jgi:hypothetical protein
MKNWVKLAQAFVMVCAHQDSNLKGLMNSFIEACTEDGQNKHVTNRFIEFMEAVCTLRKKTGKITE